MTRRRTEPGHAGFDFSNAIAFELRRRLLVVPLKAISPAATFGSVVLPVSASQSSKPFRQTGLNNMP